MIVNKHDMEMLHSVKALSLEMHNYVRSFSVTKSIRSGKFLLTFLLFTTIQLSAQDTIHVLHYTETTGYDHNTRNESKNMFLRICDSLTNNTPHEWILTNRNSSEIFDTLSLLMDFKVVIWSNTSGDNGLTPAQRSNYETYVNSGGNYLGIHAASDTYRHSTANGGSTGIWDFYAEQLSGCSVQQSPNHTPANHNNLMDHYTAHPILDNIPDPWNKTEEYYYWEYGFVDPSFDTLLTVRTTGVNSYDSARMITQYRELPCGSRSFYTALGHGADNYTDPNNEFEILNKNALYWVANPMAGPDSISVTACDSFVSPSGNHTWVISGIFHDTLTNTAGCDSFLTIDLTINYSHETSYSMSACNSYTWPVNQATYSSSGVYTETISSSAGCDSTVTLNLTIDAADVSVTHIVDTLTANAENASYQWYYCDSGFIPIAQADSQHLVPTQNGSYAVEVTQNNCVDTSECMEISTVGINQSGPEELLSVYPNPTTGNLLIVLAEVHDWTQVTLKNCSGQVCLIHTATRTERIDLNFSAPAGLYFLEIATPSGSSTRKVIKQ